MRAVQNDVLAELPRLRDVIVQVGAQRLHSGVSVPQRCSPSDSLTHYVTAQETAVHGVPPAAGEPGGEEGRDGRDGDGPAGDTAGGGDVAGGDEYQQRMTLSA